MAGPDGPVEKVSVIGYGNQGAAQAKNMRDSGLPVTIGLRKNSLSWKTAEYDGFDVMDIAGASKNATVICILVPDEFIHEAAAVVQKHARNGSLIVLAHGSSIHFGRWVPESRFDCGLIAPHGPGIEMRRLYESGSGVPAILAEINDVTGRCRERLETLAAAIGSARTGAGVHWSTCQVEVETDLFVEQALLVGGVIELLRGVVATMILAGYDPAVCRMSTLYELPHIANIYETLGPVKAFKAISPTAAFGAATRGPRIIDQHTRRVMQDILDEIRNGTFVDELVSPEAPLILQKYISTLESSSLSASDRPFHSENIEDAEDLR
jgi:ketol-acid reductoisomerase